MQKSKNDQPSITFSVFLRVGAFLEWSWGLSWEVLERYFGRCWLQDCVFGSILSDVAGSWRQNGEQKRQGEAFGRKLGGWLEGLGEPGGSGTGENPQC